MKQIGLASYDGRLAKAAETLLTHQGFDGGWGLTLTSVSSIVNTSEVLVILRAAGAGGKPVRKALTFLSRAIEEHCRPRQKGGRGENARFVCFGLTGLLSYPEFFTQPGLGESAQWCVDWLERHQVDQGWPEVAGIDDTSLHQTALAVLALSTLRETLTALGPDLMLAGGVNTSTLLDRVDPLIGHGVSGLLYHRRSSGAWGWRTYVDTAPSPSKTSLCLMAVAAAAGRLSAADAIRPDRDTPLEAGGASCEIQRRSPSQVVAEAAGWLLRNHHRWEIFVEDDKDVQGTAWEHMAYALGVQAVLRAGGNPYDRRLARAWRLMNELWDAEAGMWNEPGASGRRATIRAAFYIVAAYQEAGLRIGQLGMAEPSPADADGMDLDSPKTEIAAFTLNEGLLRVLVGDDVVECPLSERLLALVRLLDEAGLDGLAVVDIANMLHVATSSVAKYVQRINHAVAQAGGSNVARLIVASRTARGSGYALTTVATSPAQARSDSTG